MISSMSEIDKKLVGARLRAVQTELGFATTQEFATHLGAERGTLDAWLNGRALPPVRYLTRLKEEHGITLDWLFYDDPSAMPYARSIRLQAAMSGLRVPSIEESYTRNQIPELGLPAATVREGPAPETGQACLLPQPEVLLPRRKTKKEAT